MRGKVPALFAAAALAIAGASLRAAAQRKATPRPAEQGAPKKVSAKPEDHGKADAGSPSNTKAGGDAGTKEDASAARYVYEFEQPDFFVYFVHIEHDDRGHGSIRFERRSDTEQLTDPLEISPAALARIRAHYAALRFLDSAENYQGQRNYPSQGKTRLTLRQGGRERTA